MAKILLVEDDNNLREIYGARLQAEGYEIASAKDGEEALVVAKKEQPDLIIADVMMPRISGFEMLDILRNTQGMQDVKVIMLTALGQAEDKTRADQLGADRYLVKSQVTLEDIVKAASDLLGNVPEGSAAAAAESAAGDTQVSQAPQTGQTEQPAAGVQPVQPAPQPTQTPAQPESTGPSVQSIPVAAAPPEPASRPSSAAAPPVSDTPAQASQTPAANPAPAQQQPTPQPPANQGPAQPQSDSSGAATPPPAQPVTASTPQVSNTAELASAVNDLVKSVNGTPGAGQQTASDDSAARQQQAAAQQNPAPQAAPAPPQPPTPPQQPNQPMTFQPAPQAPSSQPQPAPQDDQDDNSDSVTIARKKIIKPLDPDSAPNRPGLNDLLNKEGFDMNQQQPPQQSGLATTPHPPGHIISPASGTPPQQQPDGTNKPPTPTDPNSISL